MLLDFFETISDFAQWLGNQAKQETVGRNYQQLIKWWCNGTIVAPRDRYGRLLGLAAWMREAVNSREPARRTNDNFGCISLDFFFAAPGLVPEFLRELSRSTCGADLKFPVPCDDRLASRTRRLSSELILRVARKARISPIGELHPVLQGKAEDSRSAARERGRALYLMAQNPRYQLQRTATCIQAIDRAIGAGHIEIFLNDKNLPEGLLIWARPSSEARRTIASGCRELIAACELNCGGALTVMDLIAISPDAARRVTEKIKDLVDPVDSIIHLRLRRKGRNDFELLRIPVASRADAFRWLQTQLAAEID